MAKDDKLSDLFKKTGPDSPPADNSDLDSGVIRSVGVGLKQGEAAAIKAMAAELGIRPNALLRFAIRWFILRARAGDVDLSSFLETPPAPAKKLNMPTE